MLAFDHTISCGQNCISVCSHKNGISEQESWKDLDGPACMEAELEAAEKLFSSPRNPRSGGETTGFEVHRPGGRRLSLTGGGHDIAVVPKLLDAGEICSFLCTVLLSR